MEQIDAAKRFLAPAAERSEAQASTRACKVVRIQVVDVARPSTPPLLLITMIVLHPLMLVSLAAISVTVASYAPPPDPLKVILTRKGEMMMAMILRTKSGGSSRLLRSKKMSQSHPQSLLTNRKVSLSP